MDLYPPPTHYPNTPTIKQLEFFFLMSPNYGETASIALPNGKRLIVYRNGSLRSVLPNPHCGTYDIHFSNDEENATKYLSESDANELISKIFSENQE